jgi:ribose 5-phosphate isomerase
MSAEAQKHAVGEAAALRVEDHMTVGLGAGTTAAFLVAALGERVAKEGPFAVWRRRRPRRPWRRVTA